MATENNTQRQHDDVVQSGWNGLEAVRMRPGMYIGDVGVRGLHYLFREIIDNSVDEVLAGHCTEINVVLGEDFTLSVSDNGRSIPIPVIGLSGKSGVELAFTLLGNHSTIGREQTRSIGTYVGGSVINALSEWLVCKVKHGGKVYQMRFEWGKPVTSLEVVGDCGREEHGTTVTWLADKTIFKFALTDSGNLDYNGELIANRCRELAYNLPSARISFQDRLHGKPLETFHFPNGVADYVQDLNRGISIYPAEPIAISGVVGKTRIEVALQYSNTDVETVLGFANTVPTPADGKHITGFRRALTKAVNELGEERTSYAGKTVQRGLTAVVSVFLHNPMFNASDRTRLDNPEVEGIVVSIIYKGLKRHFNKYPDQKNGIVERMIANTKSTAGTKFPR